MPERTFVPGSQDWSWTLPSTRPTDEPPGPAADHARSEEYISAGVRGPYRPAKRTRMQVVWPRW